MNKIKIMAFDMDNTLLCRDKHLSERNKEALKEAASRGIEIVPSTGRLPAALPAEVMDLGIVNYVISINGSYVFDVKNNKVIYSADMSCDTAIKVMEYLDTLPTIYDCYCKNEAFMSQRLYDVAADYAQGAYLQMIWKFRQPVPELKDFVREGNKGVQKIQFFMTDLELMEQVASNLKSMFPNTAVTSSVRNNVEVNDENATKGKALMVLAKHLGADASQTMAFGDGSNDRSMLEAAGVAVAMENGREDLKAIADIIAPDCDESGCAVIIEKYLAGEL